MKSIISFLRELTSNNNRIWFNENKERYLAIKEKVETLTSQLINRIAEFEPDAIRLRTSDCLYRIYRDTRFSLDKTPYKTHIGIYINPPFGRKSPRCGYYLHLEPNNCLVAGGSWCPDTPFLKRIRQDIYDNIEEYLEIIESPEFTRYYSQVGYNPVKTAPKGFSKDWEYIDLIKPRDYTTLTPITNEDLNSDNFIDLVIDRMIATKPLNDFFNYSIDETLNID